MAKMKFIYAVRPKTGYEAKASEHVGIYQSWNECETHVKGNSFVEYKKFKTQDEALEYMNHTIPVNNIESKSSDIMLTAKQYLNWLKDNSFVDEKEYQDIMTRIVFDKDHNDSGKHVDVYVDGSYNVSTNEYGYGVYMESGSDKRILCGRGVCQDGGRNVEGEVAASKAALMYILNNNKYNSVTLYHDYQGIGSWADKSWSANKEYTQDYASFVDMVRSNGVDVTFKHVDGHTGVVGNEYVDKLAKMGCGIELTSSEKQFIKQLSDVKGFPPENELPKMENSSENLKSIGCVL